MKKERSEMRECGGVKEKRCSCLLFFVIYCSIYVILFQMYDNPCLKNCTKNKQSLPNEQTVTSDAKSLWGHARRVGERWEVAQARRVDTGRGWAALLRRSTEKRQGSIGHKVRTHDGFPGWFKEART